MPSHPLPSHPLAVPLPRNLLVGPLVAAVLALFAGAPPAEAGEAGGGTLLLRRDGGAPVEAPRLAADATVAVSGPTARATITQAFRNTSADWVEGTYLFPLPEDAAVDTMKLVVGDRVIVADIRERRAAQEAYEAARAQGRTAALTEQHRPNLFSNAVANIGPGETVLVQIAYQQTVRQSGDTYSLRLPTVAAPRYSPAAPPVRLAGEAGPGGAPDPVPDRDRIAAPVLDPARHAPVNPLTLAIDLKAGFPIGSVRSATHAIRVEAPSERERRIVLRDGATAADRDFELTWTAAAGAGPAVGLFRERVAGADNLLAVVTPPEGAAAAPVPRDVVFVIDNSGSMGGTSIRQAKASLLVGLDRLRPGDRFNVIRFDDTMETVFPDLVAADPGHLARAKRFVAGLEARGGTEMLAPLRAALRDARPEETERLRQVVFLTDGAIGNEAEIFASIAEGRGRTRLFMVGIGSAPNGHLMRHAAELGRGSFTLIGAAEEVADRMRELLLKLESPVVTDLSATFSEAADVTPARMPDLYRGEPVVVAARMREAGGTLTLSGRIGDAPWQTVLRLEEAADGVGIGKVWARSRIGETETLRVTGRMEPAAADAEILRLALDHGLTTRLTALVAVDATPRRPDGARLARTELPLNLPAGWDFEALFGRDGEAPQIPDLGPAPRERRAALPPVRMASSEIALPQTATDFEIRMLVGALLLGLGLLLRARRRVAS